MHETGGEFPEPTGDGTAQSAGPLGHAAVPPARRRDRMLAGGATVGAHLALLAVLLWHTGNQKPPPVPPPPPIQVSILASPKPQPPGPAAPQEVELRPAPPQVSPPVLNINSRVQADTFSDVMSDSQLAGAVSAGEGGGGGGGSCDMARAVQQALRRDRLVRPAVADANRLGKSILLWDGDWVQTGAQEGKGLSAVREAVMWEVAFVPEACRNQRMRGLILLSLEDGRTRFAIGKDDWRWSDLLGLRRTAAR